MEINMQRMIEEDGGLLPGEMIFFFRKSDEEEAEHEDIYCVDLLSKSLRRERVILAVTKKFIYLF